MRWDEFEEFVDAELPRLLGLARALTGSEHDAWDLTQETFARVGAKWGRVQRAGNPAAYARTTLVRLNLDRYRRSGRESLVAAVPDRGVTGSVYQDLEPWLAGALGELTPKQRTVVVLRFVHDLALSSIAAEMGCSLGTVKSHLSRGLERLRKHAPEGERHG